MADNDADRGIIELRNAGKLYTKYEDAPMLLNRLLQHRPGQTRRSKLWAVRGLDLTIEEGESFGVIGQNGSGKSTMLRMLAGVTAPTEGLVAARGRVAPLIAVGVGFHPELTGRENVYVNGAILGLNRAAVDQRFDEIVAFSEIESFIDTPVKFYSSGMFVRLGFAVAVAAQPEILLIDEVLAVGDFAFQAKCFTRMEEMRSSGATILVVSHNLNVVRHLCRRTLLLHNGVPMFIGDTDEAISRYHALLDDHAETSDDGAPVKEVRVELLSDHEGRATHHIRAGSEVTFRVTATAVRAIESPAFAFALRRAGEVVYTDSNRTHTGRARVDAGQKMQCDVRLTARLPTGSYSAAGAIIWGTAVGEQRPSPTLDFYVSGRPLVKGLADLEATFSASGDVTDHSFPDRQGGGSFQGT